MRFVQGRRALECHLERILGRRRGEGRRREGRRRRTEGWWMCERRGWQLSAWQRLGWAQVRRQGRRQRLWIGRRLIQPIFLREKGKCQSHKSGFSRYRASQYTIPRLFDTITGLCIRIRTILGRWIRIRITVKSWVQIRIGSKWSHDGGMEVKM
jgi:hypothetical protein